MPRRWPLKNIVFSLLMVLISVSGVLFTFRLLVPKNNTTWRVDGVYALDPELGFFHKPYSMGRWTDLYGNTEDITINSLGLRGKELDLKSKKKKVLFLGDSMVFGHGVSDDDTMAYQLEKLMAPGPVPAQVINGGVKGYGIDQEHKLLQRLLSLHPDYVVWFLYCNDFIKFNNVELILYDYDLASDRLIERDISRGVFYQSTKIYLSLRRWIDLDALSFIYRIIVNRASIHDSQKFRDQKMLTQKFGKMTRLLADAAKARGFKAIFITLPDQNHEKDLSFLKEVSALPIIDLNQDSRFIASWDQLFLHHDSHLSRFGHGLVAERVREWIERNR